MSLVEALRGCVPLLAEDFRRQHERLFSGEHLAKLAERLLTFHRDGVPAERPPPHFAAEVTPPLDAAFASFRAPLDLWERQDPSAPSALAEAFTKAGCGGVLLLLGQRLTPASVTDERGIPPERARLLGAATRAHRGTEKLTVAGRALTKHVHRSPEAFWGEVSGPAEQKNAAAVAVLNRILDGVTWWNVFGHYQHELVFEARVPTGHGARWGRGGDEFIGFLEPFDEEQCPTLRG